MALRALQGPTGGGTPVGGTGTTNTIPRWTGPSTLGDSGLIDDGTKISATGRTVTIGTTNERTSRFSVEQTGTGTKMATFSNAVDADFEIKSPSAGLITIGPGTGALSIQAGGAAAIRVLTTGNVGIGTASPATRLHVNAGNGIRVTDATGTAGFDMVNFAGDAYLYNRNTGVLVFGSSNIERMRINSAGAAADSQVAIGTTSFTSGRALTTVQDLDVYGVRVGRGAGANNTNTVFGAGAFAAGTSTFRCVAVGQSALAAVTSGNSNTAVGAQALVTNQTGNENVAVGSFALQLATADKNIAIGHNAAANLTTGTSNIVIGITAPSPAVGTSNMLALGSSTNWVATNGAAATYYNTATALSTGTLPATCGFIRVYLNGSWVKIPVYAD